VGTGGRVSGRGVRGRELESGILMKKEKKGKRNGGVHRSKIGKRRQDRGERGKKKGELLKGRRSSPKRTENKREREGPILMPKSEGGNQRRIRR